MKKPLLQLWLLITLTVSVWAVEPLTNMSLDNTNYPTMNLSYSGIGNHDIGDLALSVDGIAVPIDRLQHGTASARINVVLVIDESGSMGWSRYLYDESERMGYAQRAAMQFLSGLAQRNGLLSTAQIGIVTFDGSTPDVPLDFTTSVQDINDTIVNLYASGGTNTFDGTYRGIEMLSQLSGPKVLIVFSDGDTNSDSHTQDDVIALARQYNVVINTIALGSGASEDNLKPMADQTGGLFVSDDGSSAVNNNALAQAFDTIYNITATASHTIEFDVTPGNAGDAHTLELVATAGGLTYSGQLSYVDPVAKKAVISSDTNRTNALMQPQYQPYDVIFSIDTLHCALANNGVVLWVKPIGSTVWQNYVMTPVAPIDCTGRALTTAVDYSATIPGNLMQAPGVQYYVSMTDQAGFTSTAPSVDPRNLAYSVAVDPNEKPEIVHTPPSSIQQGADVVIDGEVHDFTDKVQYIVLYYKNGNDIYYSSLTQQIDAQTANFSFTIPAADVAGGALSYFLKAVDNNGISAYYGRPGSPRNLSVASSQALNDFVERLYTIVLNRPADASGLTYWVQQLSSGSKSGASLVKSFVMSPEFQNAHYGNDAFLNILYNAIFDRVPDNGGYNFWMNALNNHALRELVLNSFLLSSEFNHLCQSFGIVQYTNSEKQEMNVKLFVSRFYTQALGRQAESAGMQYWSDKLIDGKIAADSLVHGFFFSKEFTNKHLDSAEIIRRVYLTMFGRTPDAGGAQYWQTMLDASSSNMQTMLDGFILSGEFENFVKGYGISAKK